MDLLVNQASPEPTSAGLLVVGTPAVLNILSGSRLPHLRSSSPAVDVNVLPLLTHAIGQPLVPSSTLVCHIVDCQTCRVFKDGDVKGNIGCPVPTCSAHDANQFRSAKSDGFKWGEMEGLRGHLEQKHTANELLNVCGFSNLHLFRAFRVACCTVSGCPRVVKVLASRKDVFISPIVPDVVFSNLLKGRHPCRVANPQRADQVRGYNRRGGPATNRGDRPFRDQYGVHSSIFPWLAEAMEIVDGIECLQDVPANPPSLSKELPFAKTQFATSLGSIFRAIDSGLAIVGVSIRDKTNLWKVLALLMRFIAVGSYLDHRGEQVNSEPSVHKRALKFMTLGGPSELWASQLAVVREANMRAEDIGDGGDPELDDEQSRIQKALRNLKDGDISKAFKDVVSNDDVLLFSGVQAEALLKSKYGYDGSADVDGLVRGLLDKAVQDGDVLRSDLLGRLVLSSVTQSAGSYTLASTPDSTGWRSYYLKQIFRGDKGASCDYQGQMALLRLLNVLVAGGIPEFAFQFFNSWGMSVFKDKGSGKIRLINQPMALAALAFRSEAKMSKGAWVVIEPFQLACGVSGGAENLAMIDRLMHAYGGAFTGAWHKVKFDLQGFYYGANRVGIVEALSKYKLFPELLNFNAAFGRASQTKVAYRRGGSDSKLYVFDGPQQGLPPGHPLSASACALPVRDAIKLACNMVCENLARDEGIVDLESQPFKDFYFDFWNRLVHFMYADDGIFYGPVKELALVLKAFGELIIAKGAGRFAHSKSQLSRLDLSPVLDADRFIIAEAMGVAPVALTVVNFDLDGLLSRTDGVDYTLPGIGGGHVVGSFTGTRAFEEKQSGILFSEFKRKVDAVSNFPCLQGQLLFNRLCVPGLLNSHRRMLGVNKNFVADVCIPADRLIEEGVAHMVKQDQLSDVEKALLRLPIAQSGLGIRASRVDAQLAWLASLLSCMSFVRDAFNHEHLLFKLFMRLFTDPASSSMAGAAHVIFREFCELFCEAKERPHDYALDGFVLSLLGLVDIAVKFQRRVGALRDLINARALGAILTPAQALGFKAQSVKGSAAAFLVAPVHGSVFCIPDQRMVVILKRRFLNTNICAASNNDVCGISGCRARVSDSHLNSCVYTSVQDKRHEAVRAVVLDLLSSVRVAGVEFDQTDCRTHRGLLARLDAVNAIGHAGATIDTHRRGNQCGADTLVRNLFPGELETAIDFTVVDDRAACRVVPSLSLQRGTGAQLSTSLQAAESAKVGLYGPMYSRIGVAVRGLAVDLSGGVGPGLVDLVKRCAILADGQLPPWANWTTGGFVAGWLRRIVCAVQSCAANGFLESLKKSREAVS